MPDFIRRAVPGVQGLTPYVPGKPIAELERELGVRDIIKLASNENPFGPSPAALDAARAALGDIGRYPDGNGHALRQRLSSHHDIDAARIVLGNGSNDVLELVARCFLGPGRNAVFSEYAFAVYPLASQATGAELRVAPALDADSHMPCGHDLDALLARVDDSTGVVFVANPNNPTGTWLDAAAVAEFLDKLPAQVVVVLDEAYFEYMDPALRCDSRALLEQHENLVVTRTFSKVHGLAGLRIGYGLTSPVIADLLNRVRQPFNANSAAMEAAIAALDDVAHVDTSVQANRAGLERLEQGLREMGLQTLPSQANFLAFDVGRDAGPINQALLQAGVIVRPLASYAMPQYLRVTIGSEQENRRFLQALRQVFEAVA